MYAYRFYLFSIISAYFFKSLKTIFSIGVKNMLFYRHCSILCRFRFFLLNNKQINYLNGLDNFNNIGTYILTRSNRKYHRHRTLYVCGKIFLSLKLCVLYLFIFIQKIKLNILKFNNSLQ